MPAENAIPSGCPESMDAVGGPKRRVIVVGGGIAGVGAGHALRRRGIPVTILEASPRPGGRVLTEDIDGFRLDFGVNLFLETYGTVRQVADELGVSLRRTPVPICGGVYRNGRLHGFYGGDLLRNRLKTAGTLFSLGLLSPRGVWEALKLLRILRARGHELSFDDPSRLLDLDTGQSIGEFFERNIGTEALERFVAPTLASYTFGRPDQVGVVYGLVAAWNFGLNGVAWPCLPEGGPGVFMDALVEACGDNLQLSTPVERIVIENGVTKGVVTKAGFVESDAVICATTATALLAIGSELPDAVREVLRRVTYSKCFRVFYGVDASPLPENWYAVTFPRDEDALMIGMTNAGALLPETVPPGKALIDALIMGERAEELFASNEEEAGARVLAEIRRFFPAMSAEPLFTRAHYWDEAVCLAPGGTMTALRDLRLRGIEGARGLFLAGEYMGVPSTNGALRSGLDAAADCTALLADG